MQNQTVIDLTLNWWQDYESRIVSRMDLPVLCNPRVQAIIPPSELVLRRR